MYEELYNYFMRPDQVLWPLDTSKSFEVSSSARDEEAEGPHDCDDIFDFAHDPVDEDVKLMLIKFPSVAPDEWFEAGLLNESGVLCVDTGSIVLRRDSVWAYGSRLFFLLLALGSNKPRLTFTGKRTDRCFYVSEIRMVPSRTDCGSIDDDELQQLVFYANMHDHGASVGSLSLYRRNMKLSREGIRLRYAIERDDYSENMIDWFDSRLRITGCSFETEAEHAWRVFCAMAEVYSPDLLGNSESDPDQDAHGRYLPPTESPNEIVLPKPPVWASGWLEDQEPVFGRASTVILRDGIPTKIVIDVTIGENRPGSFTLVNIDPSDIGAVAEMYLRVKRFFSDCFGHNFGKQSVAISSSVPLLRGECENIGFAVAAALISEVFEYCYINSVFIGGISPQCDLVPPNTLPDYILHYIRGNVFCPFGTSKLISPSSLFPDTTLLELKALIDFADFMVEDDE